MMRCLLLLLLCLSACDRLVGPGLPDGAVPFNPPVRYQYWWDMVQACSGLTGDLRSVRWFHVPGAYTISNDPDVGSYNAIWYRRHNRIVLAGAVVHSGHVVRHEMLHALLQAEGHPRDHYQTNCGGVVTCSSQCENEGGGRLTLPSNTPVMRGDDFPVQMQIFPAPNTAQHDAGVTSIMLTATNPHEYPVWVSAYPTTFRVRLERQDGPEVIYAAVPLLNSFRVAFDARGRRRYAFDLEVPPGTYLVHGIFDQTAAEVVEYHVPPAVAPGSVVTAQALAP